MQMGLNRTTKKKLFKNHKNFKQFVFNLIYIIVIFWEGLIKENIGARNSGKI